MALDYRCDRDDVLLKDNQPCTLDVTNKNGKRVWLDALLCEKCQAEVTKWWLDVKKVKV